MISTQVQTEYGGPPMELVPTGRTNAANVGANVLIPPPQLREKCFLYGVYILVCMRYGGLRR